MTSRRRKFGNYEERGRGITVRYHVNGERHVKVLPPGSTESDAELFLRKTELELALGTWLRPTTATMAELLDEWCRKHAADIALNTLRLYSTSVGYLREALGSIKVCDLTPAHVEAAKLQLLRRPLARKPDSCLSAKSVKEALAVGKQAMQWAGQTGLATTNPFGLVKPPRRVKTEMRILDESEARAFLRACQAEDSSVANMLAMALWTGWRAESELGGLRWKDVDDQRGTIRLAQVWLVKPKQMVPAGNSKHHPRTIRLTPEMQDILQRQRAWQKRREWEATRQEGYAWKASGLVFTSPYGEPMPEWAVLRAMTRLCAAAGLERINPHALRHTAASLAFARGASVLEVQDMLGHSSAVTTLNVYGHLVRHDGALTALAGALREEAR
jgi:integrase